MPIIATRYQTVSGSSKSFKKEAETLRTLALGTDGTVEVVISANAKAFRLRVGTSAD